MKKDLTEMVFILDRSGSMSGLEKDTIGGFNSLLEKQKNEEGEARITTVLFDNEIEFLHDRIDIKGVRELTSNDYFVRGSTALLDAVGMTIDKIVRVQKNTAESERADKVRFVIITDGMENASREYSYAKIKQMISLEKEKYGWEFLFIGANIDAVESAAGIGISADRAVNYNSDAQGTAIVYDTVCAAASNIRQNAPLAPSWSRNIDEDYRSRNNGTSADKTSRRNFFRRHK